MLLVLFNYIFTFLTAWSLGYVCVDSSRDKYYKWFGVFFYIIMIISLFNTGFELIYGILGLFVCFLTTFYTYIPKFGNGHNHI